MTTATAPSRTPDSEIDVRKVIRADWDSETPGTEPWSIVTVDKDGKETVHHEGHDLDLALRLGFHREAQRLHEKAAKDDTAEDDARDAAEFEAWKQKRDAAARAEFDAQRASATATPTWENVG